MAYTPIGQNKDTYTPIGSQPQNSSLFQGHIKGFLGGLGISSQDRTRVFGDSQYKTSTEPVYSGPTLSPSIRLPFSLEGGTTAYDKFSQDVSTVSKSILGHIGGGPVIEFATHLAANFIPGIVQMMGDTAAKYEENIASLQGKNLNLPFDARRVGFSTIVPQSSGAELFQQALQEEKDNPSNGNPLMQAWNASKAVAKTIIPDAVNVIFSADILKGGLEYASKSLSLTKDIENSFKALGFSDVGMKGGRIPTRQEVGIVGKERFINLANQGDFQGMDDLAGHLRTIETWRGSESEIQQLTELQQFIRTVSDAATGDFTKIGQGGVTQVGAKLLPSKAGFVPEQPFQPKTTMPFGLSTEEVGGGPLKPIPSDLESLKKANPMLFNKAQKATNVDEFISSVFKGEIQKPSAEGISNLTNFYNKVTNGGQSKIQSPQGVPETSLQGIQSSAVPLEGVYSALGEKATPEINQLKDLLQGLKTTIEEHPAASLAKYADKNGELPEVLGQKGTVFGKTGDQIANALGFQDSEQARASYQNYRKIREQYQNVQNDIRSMREEIRVAKEQNRFTDRLAKDIKQRLLEKRYTIRQLLDAQERAVSRGVKIGTKEGIQIGKKQILEKLPAPLSQLTEAKLLAERMKTLSRGARMGAFSSRQDIEQAQSELVAIIKKSNLDLNDKGKFLSAIKNIQGKEDLLKALPDIQSRIENLVNLSESRGLKSDIKDLLAETKVRLQSGKPVGKYTPEIQKLLDQVRTSSKLTITEARAKIQANLEKYSEGDMPVNVSLENEILNMTIGMYKDNPAELKIIKDTLSKLVEQGFATNFLKKFNNQAEIDGLRTLVKNKVLQGKNITVEDSRAKLNFKQRAVHFFKGFGKNLVLDWNGLMETMDGASALDKGKLVNTFSVHEQNNVFKNLGDATRNGTMGSIKEAYGLEKDSEVFKKISNLGKEEVNLGEFVNAEGKRQTFTFTRGELMKRYIEMKDPSLVKTLEFGNKQTLEINTAIEKALTIQDKEMADNVLEIYHKQYDVINPVYRELYGVDLPLNEFYSNIQRKGYKIEDLNYELERPVGNGIIPQNFTKSRVANTLPLGKQDIFTALFSHLSDTNYWTAWAEKMQTLRDVFLDPTVKEVITQEYGKGFYRQIVEKINKFAVNGRIQASGFDKILNVMRKNYTRGVLMIKPKQVLNQMSSIFAYLEKMSPVEFTKGVADFWLHPIENIKTLAKESVFIRDRAQNSERDISYAMNSNEYQQMKNTKFNSVMNIGMANVTMGDKLSVAPGSWAMRKQLLSQGMPLEKVIAEYEKFANATQQSSDISNLSAPETGDAAQKVFTMFKSFNRQSLQREILGIRKMFEKDGFTKENIGKAARVISIYHILLPVLSAFVADFGRTDKEAQKDYLRAAILGPVNGLFLFGDIADGIIRAALGQKVWSVDTPIAQVGNDILKTVQGIDLTDLSLQDLKNSSNLLSETTGLPFSQAVTTVSGFQKILDDNTQNNIEGVANLGGWSDYSTSGGKKNGGGLTIPGIKIPSLKIPSMKIPSIKIPSLRL